MTGLQVHQARNPACAQARLNSILQKLEERTAFDPENHRRLDDEPPGFEDTAAEVAQLAAEMVNDHEWGGGFGDQEPSQNASPSPGPGSPSPSSSPVPSSPPPDAASCQPIEDVYDSAAEIKRRVTPKFERIRRKLEKEFPDLPYYPFSCEKEWNMARWLHQSGMSQAQMDRFFHLQYGRTSYFLLLLEHRLNAHEHA